MTHPLDTYFQKVPGESRQTVSRRSGISEMHISRIIRGEGDVSTKSLRAVSQATGGVVSVADLASAFERAAMARNKTKAKRGKEPTAA